MKNIFYSLAFALVVVSGSAYDEEKLKEGIRDGIFRLTYDIKNEAVQNDILGYFPEEISELAPQVRRYFMGKEDGYTTTKVSKSIYIEL